MWTGTTPLEKVQNPKTVNGYIQLPALYYLGKGQADFDGIRLLQNTSVDTEQKCAAACETGMAYDAEFGDTDRDPATPNIPYPGSEVEFFPGSIKGFEFFNNPTVGPVQCVCLKPFFVDDKVNGKYYDTEETCGAYNNAYQIDPVSCDSYKSFCYGCLDSGKNGGELAPSTAPTISSAPSVSLSPSQSVCYISEFVII